jgi:serine/threonine protein kinase
MPGRIFSLGAVIHEMISGQRPFPGDPLESSYAILHKEPAPLSDALPRALVQVVNRCLEKEPSRRCQSVSDLAFDLDVLRDSGATAAVEEMLLSSPQRPNSCCASVALRRSTEG